ncbi:hypothetical protein EV426DRAFT_668037 [Tirmania nivea]|nr:hypothetical protein EV426DRAFT_668037 [Tirmania nivea]
MAIFVDLGEEDTDHQTPDHQTPEPQPTHPSYHDTRTTSIAAIHLDEPTPQRPPPCLTSLAAPYPVIYSLASNLDHNDLASLANTCKLMRETMLQYRRNLLGASLVCSWGSTEAKQQVALQTTGRRVLCVRDLVDRCGTCGEPACRNCVNKPGTLTVEHRKRLACRVRRLCRQCQTSPEVLNPNPDSKISHKICTCATKLLWQCRTCANSSAPLTTHKSFQTLLYHEKLQSIECLYCTHFQPPSHPPNSAKVWVEECPSPTHNSLRSDAAHRTTKPITCAMELFNGGWAYQDLTTGYIYRPPPESCIGATADWWKYLASDPNKGGFITYPTSTPTITDVLVPAGGRCTSRSWAKWARLAGKGQDARGIGVALKRFDQVSFYMSTREVVAINAGLRLAKMHGVLREEREGVVRGWCAWCEGVVLAREEEGLEWV